MPNRCGIIHARGPQPQNKISSTDIQDYIKNFETKMSQFLAASAEVSEEELKKLGAKDIDAEVEKFISANSQELAKDKWLCPLSGKKFKGPDYIRKHIMSKHAEKVEEVKKEVEYFNNYLKDSKRPQLPEHPGNAKKEGNSGSPMGYGRQPHFGGNQMPYGGGYPGYGGPMMMSRGRGGFGRGGGGRMDIPHRPLIHYRDLDAPSSSVDDIF
jgi:Arsenite-resistance protein 2